MAFGVPVTSAEVASTVLALAGFIGTILILILNLKVSDAVSVVGKQMAEVKAEFQKDMGNVRLEVANLRAESAKEQSSLYQQIMNNMGTTYATRKEAEQMHGENRQRLDGIEHQLRMLAKKSVI